MKTPCTVIEDLIPLYVDGICSEESSKIVGKHLAECEDCRKRMASFKNDRTPEIEFAPKFDPLIKIRKANIRKIIWTAIAMFLSIVLTVVLWSAYRHVFNIVDTVWSDDGTKAFVVYDREIGTEDTRGSHFTLEGYTGLSGNRSEAFALHWLGRRNRTTVIYQGIYEDGFWSPDGSKFVVNASSPGSDLHILDVAHHNGRNIDLLLKGCIANEINAHPEQFGYTVPHEADTDLTFLQWSEDSNAMLIYFRITDDGNKARSGYCWYDYEGNTVGGFMTAG